MRLFVLLSSAVIAIAGSLATAADESPSLSTLVEHYVPVRTALADDDLEGVKEHAETLATAKDRKLAAAARSLADAEDIADARKAFGAVSKALLTQVEANEKAKKHHFDLPTLHVFECPMAKPYGKWLQTDAEISNPYMGSSMPRCGSRTDLLGGGGEPKRLLADYFPIRTALAADSLEGVKNHAEMLALANDRELAKAAKSLASAENMVAARKAFGGVSKALIEQVEANEKKKKGKVELPTLHLYDCPMASPYGRWLQDESGISNPYMGSRMPRCGTLVQSFD